MKIKINKDTKIFVSVSKLPGNTGFYCIIMVINF